MTARQRRHGGEGGAIAIFAVVIVMALFLAIGLVVDGGNKIRAMQRANAMAAEAARTGAQAVIIDSDAGHPTIDFALACRAATSYVTAAGGQTTDCRRVDDTTVQVDTAVTFDNVFLSLIGPPTAQATGSAQARLARGVGTEQ